MQEFITLANRLADEAGKIVQQYFRAPYDVATKEDNSPVTIADRTIETRLREIIMAERPQDGIHGEEFENKPSDSGFTWVIDPIDGTKPFICGHHGFGTLIALCENDLPILGVIDQAITKDRWVGAKGLPTTHNGQPVTTRKCDELKNAITTATAPGMFFDIDVGFYRVIRNEVKYTVWGGDCISYGLLASGHVDMVIEASMSPHDYLAHAPIIEGAGGKVCDWDGNPLSLNSGDALVALGNADLWPEVQAKIISKA